MAGTYLPLAALLATAVTLLVATSTVPVAAAAAADKYSGRMVIIRAPGATAVSAGGALSKWQQRRRLVEDDVAPEFGGDLLGADGHISYAAEDKNRLVCLHPNDCPARGQQYTGRPCSSYYGCSTGHTVGYASRGVHV